MQKSIHIQKAFFALALLLVLSFNSYSQSLYAIIVGDTLDDTIGASVASDVRNLKAFLNDVSMNTGMRLYLSEIIGNSLTVDSITSTIKNLSVGSNDFVFFYYTGHGYRTQSKASRFPNMVFQEGNAALDIEWVNARLLEKKARFVFTVADSCNVIFDDLYAPPEPKVRFSGDTKAAYTKLFKEAKGSVIASSSVPGEPSQGYTNGGAYSLALLNSLKNRLKSKDASWQDVFTDASAKIDFGSGLVQNPQFDLKDEKNKVIATEKKVDAGSQTLVEPNLSAPSVTNAGSGANVSGTSANVSATSTSLTTATPNKESASTVLYEAKSAKKILEVNTSPSWTLLFYFMADCNLEDIMIENALRLAKASYSPNVKIVLFIDRSDMYSNASLGSIPDFKGTKYIEVSNGNFIVKETLGRINSCSKESLSNFVSWAKTNYKSSNYGISFSDHGSAWEGFGGDESWKGAVLGIKDLSAALSVLNKPFSFVLFDSCFMANYEVAASLKNVSDFLIAGIDYMPGHGLDYSAFESFTRLGQGKVSLYDVFLAMLTQYQKRTISNNTASTSVFSVYSLSLFSDVMLKLESFLQSKNVNALAPLHKSAASKLFYYGASALDGSGRKLVDLYSYASILGNLKSDYVKDLSAIKDQLESSVLLSVRGSERSDSFSLSVFMPDTVAELAASYSKNFPDSLWNSYLKRVISPTSAITKKQFFVQSGKTAVHAYNTDKKQDFIGASLVSAALADLKKVSLGYGIQVATKNSAPGEKSVIFLGKKDAKIQGEKAGTYYERKAFMVRNANTESYVYALEQKTASGYEVSIPFRLYKNPKDKSVYSDLTLVAQTDASYTILKSAYYEKNAFNASGEVFPDSASLIVPLALGYKPSSQKRAWFELGTSFTFDGKLTLKNTPLPEKEAMYFELSAEGFVGESDFCFYAE